MYNLTVSFYISPLKHKFNLILQNLDCFFLFLREMEVEMAIREKALQDENFPHFDVIAEFSSEPDPLKLEHRWDKPHLTKFLVTMLGTYTLQISKSINIFYKCFLIFFLFLKMNLLNS